MKIRRNIIPTFKTRAIHVIIKIKHPSAIAKGITCVFAVTPVHSTSVTSNIFLSGAETSVSPCIFFISMSHAYSIMSSSS